MDSLTPDNPLTWAAVAVILVAVKYVSNALNDPLASLPGPWYTKFTSAVYTYYQIRGRAPVYVYSLHVKYGPIVRIAPDEVDISNPAAARTIYQIKGEFLKSPWYHTLVQGTPSVFNETDPHVHRRRRRLLFHPLSDTGLRPMVQIIDDKIQLAIEKMTLEMREKGSTDIYKWWLFMATDIIGLLSFGDSFRMLDKGEKNQYIMDIESTGDTSAMRMAFPSWTRWLRKVPFVPWKCLKNANEVENRTMQYAQESLQRHQRLLEENPEAAIPTLFSNLYNSPPTGETALSPLELAADAQAYIVGGSDTLSKTLTYLVWAVCRHPTVQQKLVHEIQQRLPPPPDNHQQQQQKPKQKQKQASSSSSFGDAEVRALPYLAMVVEETLRLYPAVPAALPRVVPHDAPPLCGRRLPAGATVTTSAYCLNRDPRAFPDPERFWPERWQNPTRRMKDAFRTFGGGSRVCLGLHLARLEIRLAAARFFHRFPNVAISTLEGMSDADMETEWYFVLVPKGRRCLIQETPP